MLLPSSSEPMISIVAVIGIISIIYFFIKNYYRQFDKQLPFIQMIDSDKYLTFLQRNFCVDILKDEIKVLEIDNKEKKILVNIGEKLIFKMPFHLEDDFEDMQIHFSKEHPDWFVEN